MNEIKILENGVSWENIKQMRNVRDWIEQMKFDEIDKIEWDEWERWDIWNKWDWKKLNEMDEKMILNEIGWEKKRNGFNWYWKRKEKIFEEINEIRRNLMRKKRLNDIDGRDKKN